MHSLPANTGPYVSTRIRAENGPHGAKRRMSHVPAIVFGFTVAVLAPTALLAGFVLALRCSGAM